MAKEWVNIASVGWVGQQLGLKVNKSQFVVSSEVDAEENPIETAETAEFLSRRIVEAALDTKLNNSQLVTAWTTGYSDSNIASEKLVKNTIDALESNVNSALADKLDDDQLITTWNGTPLDSKIASEKLVKDTLDTKLNNSIVHLETGETLNTINLVSKSYIDDAVSAVQSDADGKVDWDDVVTSFSGQQDVSDSKVASAKLTYDSLAAKLSLTNVANAWLATHDDDHVPSEKLVYTTINTLRTDMGTGLDAKLDDSQLVTSWTATTTDTNIPSEKLVKDTIDTLDTTLRGVISTAISDLINGAPETYDTLKEISDWISTHGTDFSSLQELVSSKLAASALVTSWGVAENPGAGEHVLADTNVPSEKLVKNTIDNLISSINSDNSALEQKIDGEITRATTAEGTISSDLSDEVTRATAAEGTLTTNLGNEVTRATGAEEALSGRIDTLETDLPAEVSRATAAEGALNSAKIDKTSIVTTWSNTTLDTNVPSEKLVKDTLDSKLGTSILRSYWEAEGTINNDTVPGCRLVYETIKAEETRATTAEGEIASDLSDEITRATGAEGTLQNNIEAEETRATAAEGTLDTKISNETTRATTAEGTLTTNLASEVTRATGIESGLRTDVNANASAITAETTRATGAEETLQGNISDVAGDLSDEVTRATGAEGTLDTKIDGVAGDLATEVARAQAAEAALSSNLGNGKLDRSQLVTTWSSPLLDTNIPSEKLVKNTLDDKVSLDKIRTTWNTDETLSTVQIPSEKLVKETINSVASNLSTEVTRATTAEGTIAADLSAEVTRATTAEGTLTTNLGNEVTRATGAEAALGDRIDDVVSDLSDEVTRATGAEGTLTTNLSSEVSRATAAEGALDTAKVDKTSIVTEWGQATAPEEGESGHQTSNSNVPSEALVQSSIATLQSNIDSVSSSLGSNKVSQSQISTTKPADSNNYSDEKIPSEKLTFTQLDNEISRATTAEGNLASDISDLDTNKLDRSQLVTSWSDPTSDTNIPSEKLVKDTLDTKVNNSQIISTYNVNTVTATDIANAQLVKAWVDQKFNSADIVTTTEDWSVTPSDSTVPSEKLVYDTIQTVLAQANTANDKVAKSDIVTSVNDWSATLSDQKVPSEKLVKETIEALPDTQQITLTSTQTYGELFTAITAVLTSANMIRSVIGNFGNFAITAIGRPETNKVRLFRQTMIGEVEYVDIVSGDADTLDARFNILTIN